MMRYACYVQGELLVRLRGLDLRENPDLRGHGTGILKATWYIMPIPV